MDVIIDYQLYIGDYRYSHKSIVLPKIVSIVNCTKNLPFAYEHNAAKRIPVDDLNDDENNDVMTSYLPDICDFIDREIQSGKKVVVHCQQGLSRSASVIVAYLMKYKHMPMTEAIELVRKKRCGALLFLNFEKCLRAWQKTIGQHNNEEALSSSY
jgi:protein-tyrosine phosphatase